LVDAGAVATKVVTLLEPPKNLMIPYLDMEHGDTLLADQRFAIPCRAELQYCLKGQTQMYTSVVCVTTAQEPGHVAIPKHHQGILDPIEYEIFFAVVASSPECEAAVFSLGLPAGVNLSYDPWPYGADKHTGPDPPRYIRGVAYGRDSAGSAPKSAADLS
jgi:primary-amine oxidase